MKPNVDLTENRDFRNVSVSASALIDKYLTQLGLGSKYPWSFDEPFDERGIFLTGNREERAQKKEYQAYKKGTQCERCGFDFTNKPWKGQFNLCFNCSKVLEEDDLRKKDIWRGVLWGRG